MLISCVNILLNYIYSKVKKAVLRFLYFCGFLAACGVIENANRRNKANTLTKIQKLKILDAATPKIFKITQKLKLISYFVVNCTVLCAKHFLLI